MEESNIDVRRRLRRQIEIISRSPLNGILMANELDVEEFSDKMVWRMMILGGDYGPFKDGWFDVEFQYPKNYPFHPPQIVMKTPIFHTRTTDSGCICTCILGPLPELSLDLWTVAKTTKELVVNYRNRLLVDVDMFDANKGDHVYCVSDKEVEQELYMKNRKEFMRRVEEHTKKNAQKNINKRIQKLLNMDKMKAIVPTENEDHFYSEFERNDTLYEGHINAFGKYHGSGKVYVIKKSRFVSRRLENILQYDGTFVNGERSGVGTEYSPDGTKKVFSGTWMNGQKNGRGMIYHPESGDIEYEGIWKEGELVEKVDPNAEKDEHTFETIEL